jgi:hypothetical protein
MVVPDALIEEVDDVSVALIVYHLQNCDGRGEKTATHQHAENDLVSHRALELADENDPSIVKLADSISSAVNSREERQNKICSNK